ncbi:hypothetical protein [Agrobacterium rosae]|uniref:hypothetical protein n=1 Tax=Agrobacterium rosae TaxID=1972867 RepID=UPI003B9F2050
MWITEKTRRAYVVPRPLRVAYLVPHSPSHALLDAVFDEAMSRWGGRRTPILKTDGVSISDHDWAFLDLWDADLIYSYVPLTDEFRDRIAFCFAPAEIEMHKEVGADGDRYDFRPISQQLEWSLKSISILLRMARQQEIRKEPVYSVLDKERGSEIARDLADSFGFLSNSTVDFSLTPYARRLSYREVGHERYAPRFRGDEVISYVSDVNELENGLSKDASILFPSQMSDMFCPHLNTLRNHHFNWEEQLTIVVGDEIDDRLLFWNSIHRYKSLDTFRSVQILRFSASRFQTGVPAWIEHLCGGVRNRRHLDGNGAANVRVISSSLQLDQLAEVSEGIRQKRLTMSSYEKLETSDIFAPLANKDPREEYEHSANIWPAWICGDFKVSEAARLNKNELDLPCVKPWHLMDFPLGPTTVGGWISDLAVERSEDHSRYSNLVHRWMFPRRLALHKAVEIESYGKGSFSARPPVRPTERGNLSIWDDPQWRRPTLRFPQDINAFYQALGLHHPNTVAENDSYVNGGPYARLEEVRLSDKGRDLLGVLKFFRNLNEGLTFLTSPYILSVISKLSPTDPSNSKSRVFELKKYIVANLKGSDFNDGDLERAAKRLLGLAARGVQKDAKESAFVNYAWLQQKLAETGNGESKYDLDECLKFLRNQDFLMQGFGWKCQRCQHSNWVGLTDMTNSLSCAICDFAEDAPIGGDANSHFKMNPFVSAAFSPTSAQGPVIWCISVLAAKARHSFMLTPTLDTKDQHSLPKGTDLDVLACVDGKIHMYEVKRSFAGIDQKQMDDLVLIASLLRPDYAGFAVEDDANSETLSDDGIQSLREKLKKVDVEFVLLTGARDRNGYSYGDVPPNIGDTMQWSIWQE